MSCLYSDANFDYHLHMALERTFVIFAESDAEAFLLLDAFRAAGLATLSCRPGVGGEGLLPLFSGADLAGAVVRLDTSPAPPPLLGLAELTERRDFAVLHLLRKDLLMAFLEEKCAGGGGDAKSAAAIVLRPDELSRYLDAAVARRAWMRRALSREPFLELAWDDPNGEHPTTNLRRIAMLIGLSPCALLMGDLAPERPPGRTADRILNWDALREAFRASPHEHLFESRRRGVRHPGFCPRPFESITIDADGRLRMCCEDWLPTPIGDVRAGSLLGQWNSPAAMAIRESVLDGSYRFCDASRCPDLVKGTLPPLGGPLKAKHRDIVERGRTWLETPPTHLSLGYDQTCNLKCPTCRNDFIVLKGEGFAHAERIQAEVIETLLPGAREVIVTGQGDAIASRLFRRFLRELDAARYPHLRLLLMTNGLTLNSTMWDSFRSAQPAIAGVSISVDAASATTYAINRGGNFESLLKNLRFLGTLKRDGKIDFLELSFVVQANNAHEMPAFVRLARALGCDSVLFMKLIHWPGTFPEEEWSLRAVHEQQHPLHGTFLETLRHPDLQWEGVDLSNLADLDPSNAPQAEVSHG